MDVGQPTKYPISNIVVRQYLNKKPHSISKPKKFDERLLCNALFRKPGDRMERITGLFYPIYTVYYDFIIQKWIKSP